MGQSATETIWVEDLRTGVVCSQPVVDTNGLLLLGANTKITQSVIDGLVDRGIESLEVDPRDLAALRGTTVAKPKVKRASISGERDRNKWKPGQPLKECLVDRFDEPLSESREGELKDGFASAKQQVAEIRQALVAQQLRTMEAVNEVSHRFTKFIVDDHDHTVGNFGKQETACDLADRSVKMASLSMAVGVEMGLDGPAVCELGTAGLMHDIGLYSMNPKFIDLDVTLSEDEWWDYQKHPIIAHQRLGEVAETSSQVRIAVEQVHEQFDGSGYPRGLQGKRIHPYARIINVVDTYLRLILPTDTRPGVVPHDALGILLHQARHGMFEPQVIRAFLQTESLFPLGSQVEMTDGSIAKVIRRPREGYAAPVLEGEGGKRIDLSRGSLQIARPRVVADEQQVRVTPEMMNDFILPSRRAAEAATIGV